MKTYAGIPEELGKPENASISIIPVPYDGTSSWGKGADGGPDAFFHASENMELYDIETDSEAYHRGVYIAPTVTEDSSPEAMAEAVEAAVARELDSGRFVTMVGGEHSISIGAIRAFRKHYGNLSVLQLDAHADLRESYMGSTCNHACALHEASKTTNLIQVGIRSMDISELEFMDRSKTYFAHELGSKNNWQDDVIKQLNGPVYITIDLDAFDPSVLPSTGTPEPGGMDFYTVTDLMKRVMREHQVVGFDIVELAPNPHETSSEFTMAKLYYKMLSYQFENK